MSKNENHSLVLHELILALRNLAAEPGEQAQYLNKLHRFAPITKQEWNEFNVDELALELEDSIFILDVAPDGLSSDFIEAVKALDSKLDRMSENGQSELWSVRGLKHREEWREVRGLAQTALDRFEAAKSDIA